MLTQPAPAVELLLDDRHVLGLDRGVAAAAVHVHDDAVGGVEELLVLRPAVASHDREDALVLLEQVHQDRTAGEELVVAGAVALPAGDDQNALAFEVGGRFDLQSDLRLVEWIDLRRFL